MTDRHEAHMSTEIMQALLDGVLGEAEAAEAQQHLDTCARCHATFEGWTTLFDQLDSLTDLSPTVGFADRIIDSVPAARPAPLSLRDRARGWLRSRRPMRVEGHVTDQSLQDLLDGVLSPRGIMAMEGHLDECRLCREEMVSWRSVMRSLDGLPRLEPSPGFTERVMAHVRVQLVVAATAPGWQERFRVWADGLSPRTRKQFAGFAGAAVTPAVSVALVAYMVLSHPLATMGNLYAFFSLQAQDSVAGLASSVGPVSQLPVVSTLVAFVQTLAASPISAVGFVGGLVLLTCMAVWILYRNLIAMNTASGRYAYF